ncbi:MAG: hypothetical protein ACOVLB_07180 [Candidatus Nanopelagicus sp.]
MKVSKVQQYLLEQVATVRQQVEAYKKVVEQRRLDRIHETRVQRNLRLDLDKGRHIDVDC